MKTLDSFFFANVNFTFKPLDSEKFVTLMCKVFVFLSYCETIRTNKLKWLKPDFV